jgi:hypothetical protein
MLFTPIPAVRRLRPVNAHRHLESASPLDGLINPDDQAAKPGAKRLNVNIS